MTHTTLRIFLYALVAATSPLALASTLIVLRTGRGRINVVLYAVAFLTAQSLVLLIALLIGVASVTGRSRHPVFEATLELLCGGALLVAARQLRRHPARRTPRVGPSRTEAVLARMNRITPVQTVGAGTALGIGGPKRIGITVLVAATISTAGGSAPADTALAVMYVAIGTVLVWLPVSLYLIAGPRAEEWIATAQHWVGQRQVALRFYPAVVVGVILVIDGLVGLLT